jgi:hypothetical protein
LLWVTPSVELAVFDADFSPFDVSLGARINKTLVRGRTDEEGAGCLRSPPDDWTVSSAAGREIGSRAQTGVNRSEDFVTWYLRIGESVIGAEL